MKFSQLKEKIRSIFSTACSRRITQFSNFICLCNSTQRQTNYLKFICRNFQQQSNSKDSPFEYELFPFLRLFFVWKSLIARCGIARYLKRI